MINDDKNVQFILDDLIRRYPILSSIKESIWDAYLYIMNCYHNEGKLLIAGNGGSAADADHIVGELMKGFIKKRSLKSDFILKLLEVDNNKGKELGEKLQEALPAISLSSHNSLNTAYANDIDGNLSYAQTLYGYGTKNDVFLGISTSGNSKNIIYASIVARAKGMKVIALTGNGGGELTKLADISIVVPEKETYKIQELHLPIYHALCLMLEERFF